MYEKYVLLKAIQRGVCVMHFVLFHNRVRGKYTVADSDVQMASRLHPLWTCHLSLQSLLAPLDTFIYLFKIVNMGIYFLNLSNIDNKVYLPYSTARNTALQPTDKA